MNFEWTEKQQQIRSDVEDSLKGYLPDKVGLLETADISKLKQIILGLQSKLAQTDYLTLGLGPGGASEFTDLLAGLEIMANGSASLFLSVETTSRMFGGLVAGYGSDQLKEEVLDPCKKGELIGAVAVSETEGDDKTGGSFAILENDEYILSGEKAFVTNGSIADYIAVLTSFEDKPLFLIVKADSQGIFKSERIKTLGYRGLAVCSMKFDKVKVNKAFALGPFEDQKPVEFLSMVEGLVLATSATGISTSVFNEASRHTKAHKRGGKEIYKYQEISFKLAEMLTLIQTSEFFNRRTAWMITKGNPEAQTLARCTKVFCSESSEEIANKAMQIMAGVGYISGNEAEKGFRDSKFAAIAGTTNEVSRMGIADYLLTKNQV